MAKHFINAAHPFNGHGRGAAESTEMMEAELVKADRPESQRCGFDESRRFTLTKSQRDRLVRLAYRFLWNVHDAEDAVQEALASGCERAAQLREQDKWWNWICGIVVQRCRLLGRKKSRWTLKLRRMFDHGTTSGGTGSGDPSSDPIRRETADETRKLLLLLSPRQREVMVLRHLEEMSYEEIGDVLGISAATARVHTLAGREALAELMTRGERTIDRHKSDDSAKR